MSKSSESNKTNKRLPRTTPPTLEELECLIMWPKGSMGYYNEQRAIEIFLSLSDTVAMGD